MKKGAQTSAFFVSYHSTAIRCTGMVMHRAPPPPRESSLPSKATMHFFTLLRLTLLLTTSAAVTMVKPALFKASKVCWLRP